MRAIVTGSCGLVGYATCQRLMQDGWEIVGIDNNRREYFFGPAGSTLTVLGQLKQYEKYTHHTVDIRSYQIHEIFERGADLIVHCAAQPSHDWAAKDISEDFTINAGGTLNILQAWYDYCKGRLPMPFIHVSTSKVYGDNPNKLITYDELDTRYEPRRLNGIDDYRHGTDYRHGIPETFPIDNCLHSFFGASKLAGDIVAQEFGRYYGLPVGIFRPGCITGSQHKGVELHGFLQYLAQCVASGKTYHVFGYKGKQVRCNVHADDLVNAFMLFANKPTPGAVYNMGGRGLDCSMMEAISAFEERLGRKAVTEYVETPRIGDHRWWISDASRAKEELGWAPKRLLPSILDELAESVRI